ncbi:hypothetical protein G7Y89_g3516 [Cudoniella acicularis]|uniref:Uncharacterized protein n=1 Tax=Cudoniella acicularis TaxID=354080 RepID=A0A8H4W7K2_9HELO|nr:hypothetical protein G7Y89_g3516 [Cudoniella acicularis]
MPRHSVAIRYATHQSLTESPLMAEDPLKIPADEVNSIGVPIPNRRPGRKLKTVVIVVASLSNLRSVAGRTERIIKDSTEEISDSNEGGEKSKNEDIINRHQECPIYQLSKDKSRSKRTFGEMVEYDLITDNDDTDSETIIADFDDEPPLKKHKKSTLTIDILIKATEEEERMQRRQAFRFNQLRRQRVCLADIQSVILGRQIGTSESSLFHPSKVLRSLINDNKAEKQKIEEEFHDRVPYYDSMVLLDRYSLLEGRRESLIETKNWIDGEDLFREEVEE